MINSATVPSRRLIKLFAVPLLAALLFAFTGLVPANAAPSSYPPGRWWSLTLTLARTLSG